MQELINELRLNTSLINKKVILQKNDSPYNRMVFKYAYDSSITYGVKFDKFMGTIGNVKEEMFHILDRLATRELSGDRARHAVENYALHNGDLIKLICNKDLSCGVSTTILNLVYGKYFIPKFAIQLAREEELEKIKFPVWAQLKYNGARVLAICDKGQIVLKSRGGHTFNFPDLNKELDRIVPNDLSIVLDGELTFGDSKDTDHTKISGLVNSSIKTENTIPGNLGIVFNIFDYLPLCEFNTQTCVRNYEGRFMDIAKLINKHSSGKVRIANNYVVNSLEELNKLYEGLIGEGYEGLILKYPKDYYTYKKNKTWIKMKATDTVDLMCTGFAEGKGKYEGQIGALECQGLVGKTTVFVNIGSGLTDSDRLQDPNEYIGKYIEVAYNKVIQDHKTGIYSLFLPRFISIRKDKS